MIIYKLTKKKEFIILNKMFFFFFSGRKIKSKKETYLNAAKTAYNKVGGNVKIICYSQLL